MDYLRGGCGYLTGSVTHAYGYLTGSLTRASEKVVEVPTRMSGGYNVRLAGLLGAIAVSALAYSAHGFKNGERSEERFKTFKNAADINIFHSLALLGAHNARFPRLTTSLFLIGTVLFCGTCYYTALANDYRYVHIAPIGGTTLIIAWLSFIL